MRSIEYRLNGWIRISWNRYFAKILDSDFLEFQNRLRAEWQKLELSDFIKIDIWLNRWIRISWNRYFAKILDSDFLEFLKRLWAEWQKLELSDCSVIFCYSSIKTITSQRFRYYPLGTLRLQRTGPRTKLFISVYKYQNWIYTHDVDHILYILPKT